MASDASSSFLGSACDERGLIGSVRRQNRSRGACTARLGGRATVNAAVKRVVRAEAATWTFASRQRSLVCASVSLFRTTTKRVISAALQEMAPADQLTTSMTSDASSRLLDSACAK